MRRLEQLDSNSDSQPRSLGVSWTDLTVKGVTAGATFNENVLSQFNPFHKNAKGDLKTIVKSSHGCVKPGEMLLVLGRPGAGCTTLLNVLANNRRGYEEVSGDVKFGTISSKDAQVYSGQIVMNTEEEVFFPTLSVQNTIDFATRMKSPRHLPTGIQTQEQYAQEYKKFLLESVGISHTAKTKVGDAFIRGVSGGERKRVSILECLTTRASVYCWDNSTRGLDASTALEYIKAIRAMTDILGLSTIVTLYQAGNGIYEQFDKVLVLDSGKQLYYGPRQDAVPFMEELGFVCVDGSNKGDFLTGVTVLTERKIAPGYENKFPRTNEDIAAAYNQTKKKMNMLEECRNYPESEEARVNTLAFQDLVAKEKHGGIRDSPVSANFFKQVQFAVIRQYQLLWGDKSTMFIKQAATLVQALIGGSLFYAAPNNNLGLFIKGGAIFFSTLYHALLALGEVTDSFTGRPVLAKHRSFALYNPAAFVIAQVVADLPILMFQVGHFSIVLYWMVGLKATAAAFFTFLVISYVNALAMTQYFRAVGAAFPTFDAATKVSGLTFVSLFMYMGYMIAKPQMHPWLSWIFWINPMAYAFDALTSNEFHNTEIPCAGPNLIPNGPGYGPEVGGQSCVGVVGAAPGDTSVFGNSYLAALSYSHSHVWRNFGILCAWWVFFIAVTVFFTSRWKQVGEGGRKLLIPREKQNEATHFLQSRDEEAQVDEQKDTDFSSESDNNAEIDLIRNKSIFTWKNLTYTVKTPDGDRVLLDNVQGYVKPGMLGALMGSSGAGKTTLLDVLAQRKTQGTINGSVFVDGRPIPVSFQRSAGYVEQLDVHEPLATVREALEFSALLRQPRDTPDKEKLRYVDTIIDLLELNALEHTLIGSPGNGLCVEQRKRLTIAVELVAKPSILIFLDEPTSGLDGQAAFNTVRFLRKLAAAGQAILVTIHQPSAQLFAQFDKLLLLQKGGKTVYFGDIGDNAATIKDYLSRNGAACPLGANPAEHMIEVVTGAGGKDKDWNRIWLESDEHARLSSGIDTMVSYAASNSTTVNDDTNEFAASMWTQTKLVTQRMNVSLYRNTEYVMNKVAMHVLLALLNGFTFWMIGDSITDLQQNLFTVFNVIFVSPGVIAQLQPLFIDRRDIFEAREKKSKMVSDRSPRLDVQVQLLTPASTQYHWGPFVTGLIVSEFPYLIVCALLYYVCWYFAPVLNTSAYSAGSVFFVIVSLEALLAILSLMSY
jgi:ABC-type multidrug transport system ATPase subunit/ABC-type multidrug transport system permease subunit